jgi:putative FmdB family regulatory protein
MPLYEYHCTHCGNHTELLQKISDEPAKTCPHCHQDHLVKQISAAGFQLKGSGWYVTDFRDKKPASSTTKTETPPEKPTEKSVEKKD